MPNPVPIPSAEPRRLPPLLRRAWYGLNQAFRRRILHTDMTPDQFTVLRTLLEAGRFGLTQSELAQVMSSDPNTVASLLDRMEKADWVERKSHPHDRRARRVRIRPSGKRKFVEVREFALELQAEVLAVLPAEDRERFLEQLSKVADACRAASEGKARGLRPAA